MFLGGGSSCRLWQVAVLRLRPEKAPYPCVMNLGVSSLRKKNSLVDHLESRRPVSRWTGAPPLVVLTRDISYTFHRCLSTGPPSVDNNKTSAGRPHSKPEGSAAESSWGPPHPETGAPFHGDAETEGAQQQVSKDRLAAAAADKAASRSSGSNSSITSSGSGSSGSSGRERSPATPPPPPKKRSLLLRVSVAAIAAFAALMAIGSSDRSMGTSSGEATRKQRSEGTAIPAAPDDAPPGAAAAATTTPGVGGGGGGGSGDADADGVRGKREVEEDIHRDREEDLPPGSSSAADHAAPTAAGAAAAAGDIPPSRSAAATAAKNNPSKAESNSKPTPVLQAGNEDTAATTTRSGMKDAASRAAADGADNYSSTAARHAPEAAAATTTAATAPAIPAAEDATNASQSTTRQGLETKGQVLRRALHAKTEELRHQQQQQQQQQNNEQQQNEHRQQQQQLLQKAQQQQQQQVEEDEVQQKEAASARAASTEASAARDAGGANTAEKGTSKAASNGQIEKTREALDSNGGLELGSIGSVEEAIEREAAFLRHLDRDQMVGHTLHLIRELEGLRRGFAEKLREKQLAFKRDADHQIKQFREDAKQAFEAQAVAALALVEARSHELWKMQEELEECLSNNHERMESLDSEIETMHEAFGALTLRAKTAIAATRLGAALSSLERAFARAVPIGGHLRELSKPFSTPQISTAAAAPPAAAAAAAIGFGKMNQLNATLHRSARAAFVPEGSGVIAHLVGNLLGCMYTLLPVTPSFPGKLEDSLQQNDDDKQKRSQPNALRQNLEALADAKMHLERGMC
ncbi:hypothetical protein ACSSS7_006551 [Eimeria intestinalis]